MSHRRLWAALTTGWGLVALAEVPAREPPPPSAAERAADGGALATPRLDAGPSRSDGGTRPATLSTEDLEVVKNLELLEHLSESDYLELLELSPDQ